MSETPNLKDDLLAVTSAYEVERSIQTVQNFDTEVFSAAIGIHDPLHSLSVGEEEAIDDEKMALLDEYDDKAARLFGIVDGYYLRYVEAGRITLAHRAGDGSVWGPYIQETALTAQVEENTGNLELSKFTHSGREKRTESITDADRELLVSALAKLGQITVELSEQ